MMEKLSIDELLRLAAIMAQDVISELDVADFAINLMTHDDLCRSKFAASFLY